LTWIANTISNTVPSCDDEKDVKNLEDWYQVEPHKVRALGGMQVMRVFRNSFYKSLQAIYPEFQWDFTKMRRVPHGHWLDVKTQRKYFDDLGKQLGVKQLDDWYNYNGQQLRKHQGVKSILRYYRGSFHDGKNIFAM
jgi:hypothetical protein